jgi:hypothetical protein
MVDWLHGSAHELPLSPTSPVRVDFVGRVASANATTSPITLFTAAMLQIVLMERDRSIQNWETEVENFIALGSIRMGDLVVEDAAGQRLAIEEMFPCHIHPLSTRPVDLDTAVPERLVDVAASCRGAIFYREVRFREGDTLRVVGTVERGERAEGVAYRGATTPILVPVRGSSLELHEVL